ncbi:hypothetical protein SAMN05421770_10426 [Granulicella rosea]|uniref:Tetratricopeptide repeat-containing protein n=1 Tax=Granulicella rosea TaxID=474952 RepID=A0A239JNH3_9BACT|nr:hypothetical protein [Granulicella rosea]SNT06893.1 hypothetical protein SAMN05421770_10426 [Granulicella rosea]
MSFSRMSFFSRVAAVCLLSTVAQPVLSFAQQDCMAGMGKGQMEHMKPIPPPAELPVPIKLTGIGNSHIAITATPEAQAWFDQGLNLLHDFWDFEANKAFEQGVRVDPNCAMCYWGLWQTGGSFHGPNKVYGERALAEAVRLKKHVSGAEKLYIEAAEADAAKNDKESVETLRKLVKKNPKDPQARIFLANAVNDGFDDKGEPKAGTKESIAILEGVLRDAPNDSAANHYWIHAMEPGNHPERAIPSAKLLASLAPTSGHMVHMPGHIFYRTGDYKDAQVWFEASTVADEKYMREQKVDRDDDWNYVHNMMYSIANLMEMGRLKDADALSDRLAGAQGQTPATLYTHSLRDQLSRVNYRLPVALRTADWDTVLALLDAQTLAEKDNNVNLRFLSTELHDFAVGMRALDLGDLAAAQAASARLDAGLWRMHADEDAARAAKNGDKKDEAKKDAPPMMPIMPDAMAGPLEKSLGIASLELRAGALIQQGKLNPAKKLYEEAAKEEKALGYREPPAYIRPVHETEAAALLKAKDYTGAKTAYDAALAERPESGFELYGVAYAKELSGDQAGARAGYQALLKAWPTADSSLPELVHAHRVLGDAAVASK